ncbi:MAG: phosphoribosyltransferase family protein [Thermoleophilia bacterium]|nr:phosphoribosyltransferase family protein [Thermoleophilia bacterium]MDH3725630.1 phosphoribosyltransferase family protein [Thermoleophilia bacterium]
MMFDDRYDAGRRLAAALRPFAIEKPIVFGVPRGGVPVAAEVALALSAPLDTVTVRKLGAPQNPELAVGAIAEGGIAVIDQVFVRELRITDAELQQTIDREGREMRRRLERFRDERPARDVEGDTVLIVDDGLATGLTDLAAVRALRARGAGRIVVAVPVGSRQAIALLEEEADEVVCLMTPTELYGVGAWYRDFSPVPDEDVLRELRRAEMPNPPAADQPRQVEIPAGPVRLVGDLAVPADACGLVLFAHGSGSSRLSTRNRRVARALNELGLATLLFDLLTERESRSRELVFDIPLLADRLESATRWAIDNDQTRGLPIGLFGASTGAAAALRAAADLGESVKAVVSRGGRPDLAIDRLPEVEAPTLLIVGSRDREVLELNRYAARHLRCPTRLSLVEGARHLFEEPGALEEVARLAGDWFATHLPARSVANTDRG